MADLNRPGGDVATPSAQAVEDSTSDAGWTDTVLTGGHHELPAVFTRHPVDVVVPSPKAADHGPDSAVVSHPSTVGGKWLLGDAYVDAQVAAVRTDTISITVGTNAFTVLTGRTPLDEHPKSTGVTRLRTEFDTRSGEVVLMLTDPTLGDHDLHLNRTPAPNTKPAPDTTAVHDPTTTDPATAPSTHRGTEPTVAV
ncbi:hypothetical protein ABZ942_09175 [Nocardia sp. NPDC046473]|uniref:hypothetical protein n=1 Tax=Nocardia sp. NPDC046473 TaxID=3155733 RepID=UPI0033EF554A